MTIVVFAGPSLFGTPAALLSGFSLRPPAECGDVARAARDGAAAIGLIDGRFETAASVWHKEILWALSKGVRVFGSSSMGALRAAETWRFGIRGVGRVFRLYRSGALRDDDEVAILHGPPDVGSIPLTEAMVNIRFTLRKARRQGIISANTEIEISRIAKSLYYKERTYDRVFEICGSRAGLRADVETFRNRLDTVRRDVKREDAIRLLSALRGPPSRQTDASNTFPATTFWKTFAANHLSNPAALRPLRPDHRTSQSRTRRRLMARDR